MSNKPLKQFHKLVREERYREARGILETAEDIDERTAEKWTTWLHELHADEWQQVGETNDKAKLVRNPHKARIDLTMMFGALMGVGLTISLLLALIFVIMSTPNVYLLSLLMLCTIVVGAYGWYRAATTFSDNHGTLIGGFIGTSLTALLLSSGMPIVYYPDGPPVHYLLSAFLLLLPVSGYLSWHAGEQFGKFLGE